MNVRTWHWATIGIYLFVAGALFYKLLGAGFVTDFLGWLACQEETSFLLLYQCFGVKGLYFIPYALLYIMTSVFGLNSWAWLLVFVSGHVLNALLVTRVMREGMQLFQVQPRQWLPFVAGLIFLVQPYQVEVLAWKACINYIACCFLMLSTTWLYMRYLCSGSKITLAGSVLGFLLMLFTLEFALAMPLVIVLLHICVSENSPRHTSWKHATLGFLLALLIYVILNLTLIGKAVGHYALDTATLHPFALGSALAKYFAKVIFFTRFLSFPDQTWLYGHLDARLTGVLVVVGIVLWYLYVSLRRQKIARAVRFGTFNAGAAILFTLPVAHLYFYYLQFSENDRYTYLAMPFVSIAFVWSLWNIRFHLGKVLIALYLCFCLYFTHFMTGLWEKNQDVYERILSSFTWDSGTVYVLNLPDNYRGTYMFRNLGSETALREVLQLTQGRGEALQVFEVMQYNMATPTDGVSVSRINDDTFRVEFNQWGTWWWRNGVGGTSYANERYGVVVSGQFYDVIFEDLRPGDKVVYFDGKRWREAT